MSNMSPRRNASFRSGRVLTALILSWMTGSWRGPQAGGPVEFEETQPMVRDVFAEDCNDPER